MRIDAFNVNRAVVGVFVPGDEVRMRPALCTFFDGKRFEWVEPSYLDPYGAGNAHHAIDVVGDTEEYPWGVVLKGADGVVCIMSLWSMHADRNPPPISMDGFGALFSWVESRLDDKGLDWMLLREQLDELLHPREPGVTRPS